jgi:hypothetical protein
VNDDKNTPVEPVAPANDSAQAGQVTPTEESVTPPQVAEDKEEKLYAGKFKNPEELEKSYEESQKKLTQLAQEKSALEQLTRQVPQEGYVPETPYLDPDSALAVDRLVEQKLEQRKSQEFAAKHADELKDPLLAARTSAIIKETNLRGGYVDPEVALVQAKQELDARIKPELKQAQAQGVEQGQELAQKKGELGAVGETGQRSKVDPNKLSSKEFAKYHGLDYVE